MYVYIYVYVWMDVCMYSTCTHKGTDLTGGSVWLIGISTLTMHIHVPMCFRY